MIKKSETSASEESFKIFAGAEEVYVSPAFENGSLRKLETFLPDTTNQQYTLTLYDSYGDSWGTEAYLELRNGGVDAVVNDIPTNDYYVATAGRGAVKALPVALTQEDLGIAVKKGNTKLLTQINDGLAKIKKDGEFAKIYHKWFGKQPPKALLHD